MICKRRAPRYDAVVYKEGMEDGWHVICDGCITWVTDKEKGKIFIAHRPEREHNLLFPYIKNKDGIAHSIHEGDYIVKDINTGDREVYSPEKFKKEFKEVK